MRTGPTLGALRLVVAAMMLASLSSASVRPTETGQPGSRVEVSLVLLDTVVTDARGMPIAGLRPEEFDLLVDNVRVHIDSVEEKCSEFPASTGATPAAEAGSSQESRNLVVLFDLSHMMLSSRNNAIKSTLRFVDEAMTDADRLMLLAFRRGLHIVSGFTSDRAVLHAKLQNLLKDRAMIDTLAIEEDSALRGYISQLTRQQNAYSYWRPNINTMPVIDYSCAAEVRLSEMMAARAVRALSNAMPALSGIPGRKALIFFTETLRTSVGDTLNTICGGRALEQIAVRPELRDLQLQANLAGVSFYSVHAGGLQSHPVSPLYEGSRDLQVSLALATGGTSSLLMNDRLAAFRQATRDLSCHYVLSWKPSERLKPGRHTVRVTVAREGARVRHREYFTTQTAAEASDAQMMAVLSSPGLYRDLEVESHGYSLGQSEGKKRDFLLTASVPLSALAAAPSGPEGRHAVQLRGAVVGKSSDLLCEFSETVEVQRAGGTVAGVEMACALEPGDHEIVVAARDEIGGALGAWWGRLTVKPPSEHAGMQCLLWGPAGTGRWIRAGAVAWLPSAHSADDPLFVRHKPVMRPAESVALTFLLCGSGDDADPSSLEATIALEGVAGRRFDAQEAFAGQKGRCRLMRADIAAGELQPGVYAAMPRASAGWQPVGVPSTIEVE